MNKDIITIDLNSGIIKYKAILNYDRSNKTLKTKKLYQHYLYYKEIVEVLKKNKYKQRRKKTIIGYQGFFKNLDIATEFGKNNFSFFGFKKIGNIFGYRDEASYLQKKELELIYKKIYKKLVSKFRKDIDIVYIKENKTRLDEINYHVLTAHFDTNIRDIDTFSIEKVPPFNEEHYAYKCSYDKDKYKKRIKNGDFKYFRDRYSGRLLRGRVYHNINNMWWVVINKRDVRNIVCWELFDINNHENNYKYRRLKQDFYKNRWTDKQKMRYKYINENLL